MKIKLALLVSPVLLAACASPQGEYPSLAIRDAERVSGTMQAVQAEETPIPATPPEIVESLARLEREAGDAHRIFLARLPEARAAAANSAGAAGTDSWARAELAIANLYSARSQAMIALAELDRLYVNAATQGEQIGEIDSVRQRVAAMIEEEDAMISANGGVLN